MFTYKLKRPNWQEGASNSKTHYSKEIITKFITIVKKYLFSKKNKIATPVLFSQNIQDPDGIKLNVTLSGVRAFISDKNGNTVEFSAYLVPELRASLLDVEGKFCGRNA